MTFERMENLELAGKRVLIREDLNVPVKNGVVGNDTRIRAALPTLRLAVEKGAKVVVMSHLGRPVEGVVAEQQAEFSLAPVAAKLSALLGVPVALCTNYATLTDQEPGSVVLLENVRMNVG